VLLGWTVVPGCAPSSPPVAYVPSRYDYYSFRAANPDIVEPNYLPFMAHPVELEDGTRALVLCRWERERFPLPVWIAEPEIPTSIQDEFAPIPSDAYVSAVEGALAAWERELEGLVSFRRVADADEAALRVRLLPEVAPAPGPSVSVLGRIALGRACRVSGSEENRVAVSFEPGDLRLYLADDYGLLNPDQVATVAMHEIGHALGARGHSPIRADVMFPIARDNPLVRGPSDMDVNSFVSLYSVANGLIYVRLAEGQPPPARHSRPPSGLPQLAEAPHVDARFGYELRLPNGWQWLETERGVIASDGVPWDYQATFQVIVRGYPSVAAYLERHGPAHVGGGRVVERGRMTVDGRPALRLVVLGRASPMVEELTFIEVGDGRVLVVIADCHVAAYADYEPWFAATLETLDIRSLGP
jgi:hypothetical protein